MTNATTGEMDFGGAIRALKDGRRVTRPGWNGKGMWLSLVLPEHKYAPPSVHTDLKPLPWIGMRTADKCFVPWLASQTDLLAEDWQVLD